MKKAPYTKYGNVCEANQIDPDKFPQKRKPRCQVQEFSYHQEDNQYIRSVLVVNLHLVNTISELHERLPEELGY